MLKGEGWEDEPSNQEATGAQDLFTPSLGRPSLPHHMFLGIANLVLAIIWTCSGQIYSVRCICETALNAGRLFDVRYSFYSRSSRPSPPIPRHLLVAAEEIVYAGTRDCGVDSGARAKRCSG